MDILKLARNGAKKTEIMHKARLSYSQLEQYLDALKRADFITEESGTWKTTEKGFHVIEACKLCHKLMTKTV
jgi:predicted transcriptional regulator